MRQVPSYLIIGQGRMAKHFCHYLKLLNIDFCQWARCADAQELLPPLIEKAIHVFVLINDSNLSFFIISIDYVLMPDENEIYPDRYSYKISENALSQHLEGQYGPGHFEGVLTIVMKLLILTTPHRAYFGEKDYQPCLLIKGLVSAFFLNVDIVLCPTIRHPCGLPLSSKNSLLNASQFEKAELFSKCLFSTQNEESIRSSLLQAELEVDYLQKYNGRLFAAVKIDNIRLIDNIPIATE